MLESGLEQVTLQRRMALTRQLLESEFASVHILKAEGESALAKILSLVQYGDYVSCHLAGLRGVDPMPVERIDRLKSGLSDPEASSLIKE
jgi:glucose/mannose-6-phosphate isomerase